MQHRRGRCMRFVGRGEGFEKRESVGKELRKQAR
jgi:hypothetical protein